MPLIMFRSTYGPGWRLAGLIAGSDSPSLRRMVELQFSEARAALALMPEALRSIGFAPAPADEEFTARCQAALDIVQRDLDVTGYRQYRMWAHLDRGWPPAVFSALPDGSYWSGAGGMTRQMDDASLLFTAASSVSGTLEEVHQIQWRVCAAVYGNAGCGRDLGTW